ncbi:hypothetical protein CLL_A0105 [Clostridium botulinum B str. Eklund 17B (NRP)]|uniref:Uncharacterized protein n=1 Tax=Clostridium botulinum (strain Eklund 17B / Type B) TaxID=935198 RepID=B2THW4_CLOBB|nr:hypothetical protein CLL_A0105 [Clostridium botulinum B str. Eklund 17B (NRP)]CDH89085.1 hypothetical protein CB17B0093 [Clostridium botulinum B str. Eklund 17B (NRP)]
MNTIQQIITDADLFNKVHKYIEKIIPIPVMIGVILYKSGKVMLKNITKSPINPPKKVPISLFLPIVKEFETVSFMQTTEAIHA